jgi:tRNA pseudouridine55 synthase
MGTMGSRGKNAVILIDKASGITSFDCLGRVKRLVNKKTGHCGTLDKFAHGLLIVLCGSYTHLVPAFMGMDKTYEATIEFGKSTDTLDPEGVVFETGMVPSFDVVSKAVQSLIGPLKQIPPAYSAIHINGKRSYQMARSMKESVQVSELLPARPITIHEASIISYEAPYLKVRLRVSKGTYIRSYARDLGHLCNSCAYVKELYRTSIGPFSVEDAISYDDSEALSGIGSGTLEHGLDLIKRIPGTVCIEVTEAEAFKLSNGYVLNSVFSKVPNDATFALFMCSEAPVCLYSAKEKKIICQMSSQEAQGAKDE